MSPPSPPSTSATRVPRAPWAPSALACLLAAACGGGGGATATIAPDPGPPPASQASLLARPSAVLLDGERLLVLARDSDELLALDAQTGALLDVVPTGPAPVGLALVESADELWVTCRFDTAIHRYDRATLAPAGTIPAPARCESIRAGADRVWVTNAAQDLLLAIDVADLSTDLVHLPGRHPVDLLLDETTGRAWVAQRGSESVAVVDLASLAVLQEIPVGALPGGLCRTDQGVLVGHLGLAGSTTDDGVTNRAALLHPTTGVVLWDVELPAATPRAAVWDPDAGLAWVACFGSDALVGLDPANGTAVQTVAVGPNPCAVARAADGRLFVLAELGDAVSVVESGGLQATWSLNDEHQGLVTPELRGERLFSTATDGANSCFGCHPGGGLDGLSRFEAPPGYLDVDTLNTPSLRGAGWTGPWRRDGSVPSLEAQSLNVLTAMGAESADPANVGQDLADLEAYVASLGPEPNPFAKDATQLSALEQAGKQLFDQLGCATCHPYGPTTDRDVHDVGTGPVDTPSLLGLWRSAPYLVDGRAATLEEVFEPVAGRHLPAIPSLADRQALAAWLVTIENPQVHWDLPEQWIADPDATLAVPLQVFDPATGRPVAGAQLELEELTGLAGVTLVQPAPTDALGRATAEVRAEQLGVAELRVLREGAPASETRELEVLAVGERLVNVAPEAGVDFVNPAYAYSRAVAVGDYDGDGHTDLFVAVSGLGAVPSPDGTLQPGHVGAPNRLLRNRGDGSFEDVTLAAGVYDANRSSSGAAFVDYDGDGDLDLYVANRGLGTVATNRLWRNEGDGTFVDVAPQAGVDDAGFSYSIFWFDYDRDGDLDLYVENLTVCCNQGNPEPDALYRNEGGDLFTDVTVAAGLAGPASGGGDGGAVGDYDDDGWQDVLKIAIDGGPIPGQRYWLLRNEGDGTFSDRTAESLLGPVMGSRGLVFGDVDNDHDLDLFVAGRGLFRNNGDTPRTFTDVTPSMGFDFTPYGDPAGERRFGHTLVDLDNDGWLDIVMENGQQPLAVFLNQGGTGAFEVLEDFELVLDPWADPKVGLGALDFDADGWMDVFLGREGITWEIGQPQVLYENRLQNGNHFLRVTLRGTAPGVPRAANGARVFVDAGPLSQMREVATGENASGAADVVQHFGLGPALVVDELRVRWPDGSVDTYRDLAADQHLEVVQGAGATPIATWLGVEPAAQVLAADADELTVQFSSQVLHGAGPLVVLWDFGDGALGTGPAPVHAFSLADPAVEEREVTVTVTDADGDVAEAVLLVPLQP